uniref:Transmembrane protein 207-like n=1 Tax=Geotrypetes seraphini TaxID=260995 RepID=A0A6P8S8W9_GEOSA|nr:transmembrane protein 207-like [Geotrypetes seraphini]
MMHGHIKSSVWLCVLYLTGNTGLGTVGPFVRWEQRSLMYSAQPVSSWNVWFCLLLLLLVVLCCVIFWILRRSECSSRRTLTVVVLNDSDAVYVTEASRCSHAGDHPHPQNLKLARAYPAMRVGVLGPSAPPSYEEIFKANTC